MVALMLSLMLGRRIGLRERSLLMQSFSLWQIGGRRAAGPPGAAGGSRLRAGRRSPAADPLSTFIRLADGIWYSLFHAVSAFCNAGFDLMGRIQPTAL